MIDPELLRARFIDLMTVEGNTTDRRRKDFNQAIFAPMKDGGYEFWCGTDLGMVMEKFDRAVKECDEEG